MSLLYALAQSDKHEGTNPAKHATWRKVVENMTSGFVAVGSRAPLAKMPVWVTPEVAPGGFATGVLRAGGDLAAYERVVADEARTQGYSTSQNDNTDSTRAARLSANRFLIEHELGVEKLREMLRSHKYRVTVPEEGCLLVFAWLCENGHAAEAQELLEKVTPLFDQLRFHAEPRDEPEDTSRVSVESPFNIKQKLQERLADLSRTDIDSLAAHALEPRLERWYRVREEILKLWMQTLDEPASPPNGVWTSKEREFMFTSDNTRQCRRYPTDWSSTKQAFVFGSDCSWPCQQYPAHWNQEAARVIALYETDLPNIRAKRLDKYTRMIRSAKKVLASGPQALTGSEVSWIRFGLASVNAKRGLPDSAVYRKWLDVLVSARARWIQAMKTDRDLYAYAIERLTTAAQMVASRENELKPSLSEDEARALSDQIAAAFSNHRGTSTICALIDRTVGMDLEQVFGSGRFKSLEMVAQILPAFTGTIRTNAIPDPDLRYLYHQILIAFAARRSLLLLNYASQVRVTELPWISVVDALLAAGTAGDEVERIKAATTNFCRAITVNALKCFGETPLCNPFIAELKPLVVQAQLEPCYLTEEIAADIFMGSFVDKFARAYEVAQEFLKGTKYQAYYAIREPDATPLDSKGFIQLCSSRAGVPMYETTSLLGGVGYEWSITTNGKLIEQGQILTTHNLAALFVALNLHESLDALDVPAILQRCWKEVMRLAALMEESTEIDWRIRGQWRRYIGYSWRQMLFFFAVLEKFAPESFAHELEAMKTETASMKNDEYRAHFATLADVLSGADARVVTEKRETGSGVPYVVAWGASGTV